MASGLLLACGGLSVGAIAIGDAASGEIVFDIHSDIAPEVIQHAILERFPGTWNIIAKLFPWLYPDHFSQKFSLTYQTDSSAAIPALASFSLHFHEQIHLQEWRR